MISIKTVKYKNSKDRKREFDDSLGMSTIQF